VNLKPVSLVVYRCRCRSCEPYVKHVGIKVVDIDPGPDGFDAFVVWDGGYLRPVAVRGLSHAGGRINRLDGADQGLHLPSVAGEPDFCDIFDDRDGGLLRPMFVLRAARLWREFGENRRAAVHEWCWSLMTELQVKRALSLPVRLAPK